MGLGFFYYLFQVLNTARFYMDNPSVFSGLKLGGAYPVKLHHPFKEALMPDKKLKKDAKDAFLKLENLIEECKWVYFHDTVLNIIKDIEHKQNGLSLNDKLQRKKHAILEYEDLKKFKPF